MGANETARSKIQTVPGYLRRPEAVSRSRSIWLEPRVRAIWSASSTAKRESAATMPCWKFGVLSSRLPGMKNGSLATQRWVLISRSIRSAATATVAEPPSGAELASAKSGSSSISCSQIMPPR